MYHTFPAVWINLIPQYQQEWQRCPVPGSTTYSAGNTGLHELQQTQQGVIALRMKQVQEPVVQMEPDQQTAMEDLLAFTPECADALPHPAGFTGVMIIRACLTPEVEGLGAGAGTAAARFPSMYC